MRRKILKCWPFKMVSPVVRMVEGYDAYDGVLGDEEGTSHRGIDYIREDQKGNLISFEVFSAHDGEAFRRESDSWGNFVIIYKQAGKYKFATVYGHLEDIDKEIPILPEKDEPRKRGIVISEGRYLGKAGISGDTKGNIQLHFELLRKKIKNRHWQKLDPYGVYNTYTSGKYPQPGESLRRCKHFWTSNKPPFADEV